MLKLISWMRESSLPWRDDEAGATSIEYGLLASLIAIASIQALDSVGIALTNTFDTVNSGLIASPAADEASSSGDML